MQETDLRIYFCQMILPIIQGWKFTRKTRKFSFHEVLYINNMTTINYILDKLLALD